MLSRPRAILLDIDGCLITGDRPIARATETVTHLARHWPLRLVTNTTSRPRRQIADQLRAMGFGIDIEQIITPCALARQVLVARGEQRGVLIADGAGHEDLAWFCRTAPEEACSVLIASEAHSWRIADLAPAVKAVLGGARLYTLQENRLFRRAGELVTDLGPVAAFVAYAGRCAWENLGKPSPLLFETLAAELQVPASEVLMVGDDAEFDVAGALRAGVGQAVLLRTGKYRSGDEDGIDPRPSAVLDSIADLPRLLPD